MKTIIKHTSYLILLSFFFSQLSLGIVPGFNFPSTANPAFVGQRAVPESLQQPKPLPSPLITVKSAPESKSAANVVPNKKTAHPSPAAKTNPSK